jgi:hypothetical protein
MPTNVINSQERQPGSASYFSCAECLAQDLKQAIVLKMQDITSFNKARNCGKVEMPSELALRAGLVVFGRDTFPVKHESFVKNPTLYESTPGKVFCDAGNQIYARVFQDREADIRQIKPWVSKFDTRGRKDELVRVVLHHYRTRTISHGMMRLAYLESEVERMLVEALKAETVNLFASLMNGKTLELQVSASARVSHLKSQIHDLESIPLDQQELVFQENPLDNRCTLTEIGICDGAMLHLVVCNRFHVAPWSTEYHYIEDS